MHDGNGKAELEAEACRGIPPVDHPGGNLHSLRKDDQYRRRNRVWRP